jgi:hypothetical protein
MIWLSAGYEAQSPRIWDACGKPPAYGSHKALTSHNESYKLQLRQGDTMCVGSPNPCLSLTASTASTTLHILTWFASRG